MEFLKNHYEKVLLGVVLLGLAVAAALLPMKIKTGGGDTSVAPPPKALDPIDLSTNEHSVHTLEQLPPVLLSGSHNLFNPVAWRRKADGSLLKLEESSIGPRALKIEKIIPLHFIIQFDDIRGAGYVIGLTQQTNKNPNLRGKKPLFAQLNEKADFGTITQAVPADKPTELMIQLPDGTGPVTVTRDTPYKRIDGYTADLRYDPENKSFRNQRIGDSLVFEGDTNNIVDVSSNYVIISDSSGKRTTIKAAP